ncbi:hypothetical protein STEG23_002959 [Scotinomys teguina]
MAKATKKPQDPVKKTNSSTSGTESKKPKTAGKKDGKASSRRCRTVGRSKVQMITKVKKISPRNPRRKASKKTTSTKKTNGQPLYGHYHRLMDSMTSPETESPGQSSCDQESDQESQ